MFSKAWWCVGTAAVASTWGTSAQHIANDTTCHVDYSTNFEPLYGPCLAFDILEACVRALILDNTSNVAQLNASLDEVKLDNCSNYSPGKGYQVDYQVPPEPPNDDLSVGEIGTIIFFCIIIAAGIIGGVVYIMQKQSSKVTPSEKNTPSVTVPGAQVEKEDANNEPLYDVARPGRTPTLSPRYDTAMTHVEHPNDSNEPIYSEPKKIMAPSSMLSCQPGDDPARSGLVSNDTYEVVADKEAGGVFLEPEGFPKSQSSVPEDSEAE